MCAQLQIDTNKLHYVMHQNHSKTLNEKDLAEVKLFALTPT